MQSYLEIARQALRQADPPEQFALDADYSGLTSTAMQRIAGVCPPGALRWAREAHPALTDKIDMEILSRLNDLWSNHAPLHEFQAVLDELVRVHSEVGSLFVEEVLRNESDGCSSLVKVYKI